MERMTMNVHEMAQQLGISRPKAYELVRENGFPMILVGKRIIIPVVAFQDWLKLSVGEAAQKKQRKTKRDGNSK